MAATITSTPFAADSGAALDILDNQNALTIAAAATGVTTLGGAAFVATAVAPSWVLGGTMATGIFALGGHLKNTTGSYMPFLKDKEVKAEVAVAVAPAAAA